MTAITAEQSEHLEESWLNQHHRTMRVFSYNRAIPTARSLTLMISHDLAKKFNEQIGHEFGASMQYVSIAAHFNQRHLTLLAKLFFAQAEEERQHAMKFVQYS